MRTQATTQANTAFLAERVWFPGWGVRWRTGTELESGKLSARIRIRFLSASWRPSFPEQTPLRAISNAPATSVLPSPLQSPRGFKASGGVTNLLPRRRSADALWRSALGPFQPHPSVVHTRGPSFLRKHLWCTYPAAPVAQMETAPRESTN